VFELDETHRLVQEAARRWCEQVLAPAVPTLETGKTLPYDLLRRLGHDLGVAGALEEAALRRVARLRGASRAESSGGGAGFGDDPMLASVLLKEISRVSPGFGMALIASLGCALAIQTHGSADLVERLAIPLLRFEKFGAWALTEPGAGSDAFGSMRSLAVPEGDELVLDGQKTFISNAPYADVFTVYARVEAGGGRLPVRGIVVERGTPGLETGPPMRKMGMHDSPTGEVFLQGCRVPLGNLLGSERCVEESVRHAATREQFGKPIAEFQAVAFRLARMELALENARNLVFKLAWAQSQGRLDARLASLAKLYCAEEAVRVSLDAIQIHGGAGYMAELPLEKLMRDAKMFEIGGGTNEIQLQTIARSMLG
jgi:alkylation response protein AidB-like acyl-CoA dehydrogenase